MSRKCHNHRPQTNPWHHEEETQNTDTHPPASQCSHQSLQSSLDLKKELDLLVGGGYSVISCIHRLGSFFWVQHFEFQHFLFRFLEK